MIQHLFTRKSTMSIGDHFDCLMFGLFLDHVHTAKRVILLVLLSIVLAFLLLGCAQTNQYMIDLSKQDMKNVKAMRTTAKNLLKTWPMNAGIIRGALGDNITKMPQEAITAMALLDLYAMDIDKLEDDMLGYSLGVRMRLVSVMAMEILKQYAPQILSNLPAMLMLGG